MHQVIADGRGIVVECLACAEFLNVGKVLGRCGRDDLVPGRDGELDGVATYARCAAPDQERRPCWLLRGHGGKLQVEKGFLEKRCRSRRVPQWDHRRAFERDAVWDFAGHVFLQDGVFLESVFLVSLRHHSYRVADDAGTFFESCDVGPDRYNFACDVVAKDGGVVEGPPGEGLQTFVDGVDGNGVVSNENLVFCGSPKGSGLDFERLAFGGCEPGGGVRCHSRLCRGIG